MLRALKSSIESRKAELDRLRLLSTAALAQLQKHYDVELTYTSNAIEGNTLTLRETGNCPRLSQGSPHSGGFVEPSAG